MTRLQLLNDPVFQSAPPTACFFYVGIQHKEYACIGIGDFCRDFSNKYEACFLQGAPNITKEELEKSLQVTRKNRKNWNPNIVIRTSDHVEDLGDCDIVRTMDHNYVLRPYFMHEGKKEYFDNFDM